MILYGFEGSDPVLFTIKCSKGPTDPQVAEPYFDPSISPKNLMVNRKHLSKIWILPDTTLKKILVMVCL